jgi:hypothetical protein
LPYVIPVQSLGCPLLLTPRLPSSRRLAPADSQIGKLHEPSKVLASSTLTTAAAARPGSIVSDILADTSSRAYAKRKFGALQSQRERNGRKKTTKKPRH